MSAPQPPRYAAGLLSRGPRGSARRVALGAAAVLATALAVIAVARISGWSATRSSGSPFPAIHPGAAPAGWLSATLPDGAVLSYPPSMHSVPADRGAASAVRLDRAGAYLLYLNATPRQGDESTANWPTFRLSHLRDDDARSVRELAATAGVRFLGGTGSCVLDSYETKAGARHYTELACLVQGSRASSVVVAAAPAANWPQAASLLERAIAAYRVL
jgi:hypothetical protein